MKTIYLSLISSLLLAGCAQQETNPVQVMYIQERMSDKLPPEGKWEIENISGWQDIRISKLEVFSDGSKRQIELFQLHQPSTQPFAQ